MRLVQIVLVTVFCSSLQSQPPPPTPTKTTQKDQNKGRPESDKTNSNDKSPDQNVFNGITVVTSGDQHQAGKNSESKPSTDWWAIGNTALVTIFTGVLALLAYRQWQTLKGHERAFTELADYMRSGLTETTKAANAARESADAAQRTYLASHRPKLIARFFSTVNGIGEAGTPISGSFVVFNSGESPARIQRTYSEVVIGDDLPPKSLLYETHGIALHIDVLHPGQSADIDFPTGVRRELDADEHIAINRRITDGTKHPFSGKDSFWANLFVIGWIEYVDAADRVRKMGFCRMYDFQAQRFVPKNDHDYDYADD